MDRRSERDPAVLILGAAIAVFFFTAGDAVPSDSTARIFAFLHNLGVGAGIVIFSGCTAIFIVDLALYVAHEVDEIWLNHNLKLIDINRVRLDVGLGLKGGDVAPMKPAKSEVWNLQKTGPHSASAVRKDYEHPPPAEFITWLWNNQKARGQVLAEKADIEKSKQWRKEPWKEWLAMMEEQGVLVRMWAADNNNAPRRFAEGMTLDFALSKFGYLKLPIPVPPIPALQDEES